MTEDTQGVAMYYALKSSDGVTWELVGRFANASRDGALHAAFPEKVEGVQYVAVASSFFVPVEIATRPVHYVRQVRSLRPVGQPEAQETLDVGDTHPPVDEDEITLHEPEPDPVAA